MHTLLAVIAATSLHAYSEGNSIENTISQREYTESLLAPAKSSELLKVGDIIDDFTLPTPFSPDDSEELTLSTLLESGPVVMTFFRGSWCPYCRDELSDLQDNIEKFESLGASVIAISPEINEKSSDLGEELKIGFYIAHDENNELARKLGLTFRLDGKTIKKYREYKINVPDSNGTRKWELPIPATYVIDQDFTVQYVFDDENYSKRAKPKDLLKVLKEISTDE